MPAAVRGSAVPHGAGRPRPGDPAAPDPTAGASTHAPALPAAPIGGGPSASTPAIAPPRANGSALRALLRTAPFLLVIASVMGLIMAGVATPSESAATGCLGAVLVAARFGRAGPRALGEAVTAATRTSCVILVIMASATLFSHFSQLPQPRRRHAEAG